MELNSATDPTAVAAATNCVFVYCSCVVCNAVVPSLGVLPLPTDIRRFNPSCSLLIHQSCVPYWRRVSVENAAGDSSWTIAHPVFSSHSWTTTLPSAESISILWPVNLVDDSNLPFESTTNALPRLYSGALDAVFANLPPVNFNEMTLTSKGSVFTNSSGKEVYTSPMVGVASTPQQLAPVNL